MKKKIKESMYEETSKYLYKKNKRKIICIKQCHRMYFVYFTNCSNYFSISKILLDNVYLLTLTELQVKKIFFCHSFKSFFGIFMNGFKNIKHL